MTDIDRNTAILKLTDTKGKKTAIAEILLKRYRMGGYKNPENETLVGLVNDVLDMASKQFPDITIQDIDNALENGFSDKYGVFRAGIYADKIIAYIRAYRSEKGVDSRINCQYETSAIKRPVTEDDIKNLLLNSFELYKTNSLTSFCCGLLFDSIRALGLVDYETPPNDYYDKAIEAAKTKRVNAMRHGNEYDRGFNMECLNTIGRDDREIVNLAKDIYVKDYFDSLIYCGDDFRYILLSKHVSTDYLQRRNAELGITQ